MSRIKSSPEEAVHSWKSKLEGLFEVVTSKLLAAGLEEKQIGTERGEYHNNISSIIVVVDAGWSKIAHKHSYNANSGVEVIFGFATPHLVFIGIKISTVLFAQLLVVKERM